MKRAGAIGTARAGRRALDLRWLALTLGLSVAAGCASGGGASATKAARAKAPHATLAATPADSATVLLWHLDESVGYRVIDSGPNGIPGTAGQDTRVDLGRIHGARQFTRSVDSFLFADDTPAFDSPRALTVEAWIRLDAVGSYEDTPIAMRWNPRTAAQSWILSIGGRNVVPPFTNLPSPGDHNELMASGFQNRATGRLLFGIMPKDAGAPRVFVSNQAIDLNRWVHVAATFDGKIVCLYVDGRLDSQSAVAGEIRSSNAPLQVGNAFDTRSLSTVSGELRVTPEYDHNPYYAFQGTIDELRISNVARTSFPYVR